MTKKVLPYGNWPSKISSQLLTKNSPKLSEPKLSSDSQYWLETRPEEKGRTVIICHQADKVTKVITPEGMSVRTRIHEYGGGSYLIHNQTAYFVNDSDQRIYQHNLQTQELSPLTPKGQYRFADFCIDKQRQQLICVCEIHKDDHKEPENCIVAVKLDGSSTTALSMLVFGNDFYSNPRLSPDGKHLSWLTWNHPNMPWDNTECWLADITSLGLLQKHRKVAGGSDDGNRHESIFQPQWSPTGELFFVSDRNEWWNLYKYNVETKTTECIHEMPAEFAMPQWVFGMSTYGFLNSYTVFCTYTQDGEWHSGLIDTMTKQFNPLTSDFISFDAIDCDDESDAAIFVGANKNSSDNIILWRKHEWKNLSPTEKSPIDKNEFSLAQAITFSNNQQQDVHAFYYPPQNAQYEDQHSALPPLLVMCHGGPTGATRTTLNLKIQYWTNRGFAVLDVNYSGSTGYGRQYRDRLKQQWGVLDVDDICCGADYLVQEGKVDPQRVAVRGSSAGGYTVLAALTFRDSFKAGASLYGIGDLSLLAEDTHKFESRYLDQLIGPYPEQQSIYENRSPLFHIDQLQCPVIFLQGLEDKVVPPNQAESMVKALAQKKIPVAYVTFSEEGHGFRQAQNIQFAIDAEYGFYASIFSLNPAEKLPQVPFVKDSQKEESL
jgi:dipeptidyl aminopeptidase/acylaminoacyl peptidase